jgi:hypothetical protein
MFGIAFAGHPNLAPLLSCPSSRAIRCEKISCWRPVA